MKSGCSVTLKKALLGTCGVVLFVAKAGFWDLLAAASGWVRSPVAVKSQEDRHFLFVLAPRCQGPHGGASAL